MKFDKMRERNMSKIMIVENPGRDQIFEFLERETGRVSFQFIGKADDVTIYENNCMTKLSCDVVKTWLEVLRESWTLGKDNIGLVLLQISGSISNCWNGKRWYFFQSPYLKLNSSRTRWWTSKMSSSIQNEVTFKVNSRSKISFF